MKLRWWCPQLPVVADIAWTSIPQTDFGVLLLDCGYGFVDGLNVVFFDFQPDELDDHAIWILAVMARHEPMSQILLEILCGRRTIVMERAPNFDIENL